MGGWPHSSRWVLRAHFQVGGAQVGAQFQLGEMHTSRWVVQRVHRKVYSVPLHLCTLSGRWIMHGWPHGCSMLHELMLGS